MTTYGDNRMLSVTASLLRLAAVGVLAAMLTASTGGIVVWSSPAPGEDLSPVGDAADAVLVTQNHDRILWVATEGEVASVMTLGWEVADGETELAGPLVIETVYRTSGSLSIGEPPKSVSFTLEG